VCRCFFIFCAVLLASPGCKKKTPATDGGATASTEEIPAVRDSLARGMSRVAIDELKVAHVGRKCVVTAQAPTGGLQLGSPPPPPGMVRVLGQTIIYSGEFDGVSADHLTVRAAYPTPGNYKRIDIPKDDVQSFHLAP
jgi:hypothetical protein